MPDLRPAAFADMQVGAHRLALLKDGEQAFPWMLEAIARARSTVCLETYILRDDRTGRRFVEALAERAAAGVEVNVLYDAWGSSLSGRFLADLKVAGVRALAYHPLRVSGRRLPEIMARLTRRDHRKSLTIDGTVGFTGGINIDHDYAAVEDGGAAWRDTHVCLEGPAAAELEYFFLRSWRHGGGAPLDEARYAHDGRRPDPKVKVITSDLRRGRLGIREEYRAAIGSARRRIFISNAYFLPARWMLRGLADAAQRGVDVRVMVAGTTDVMAVLYATRSVYERLLDAGVRLFEWRGRVLHAKTAVVDGRWSTIGSTNLDQQSLRFNLEANAIVEDQAFAGAVERMFEDDLEHCEEVDSERWHQRSNLSRAVSWGAYLLHPWL